MAILLINANSHHIPLADGSVQCVVTSPPYWGLRDYDTPEWSGGSPACDHQVRTPGSIAKSIDSSTLDGGKESVGHSQEGYSGTCPRCGAVRKASRLAQVWGGEKDCVHEWIDFLRKGQSGGASSKVQIKGRENFQIVPDSQCSTCSKCGAWYGQLGLEPAPDLFIEHLVEVFREVRRVLRDDGTLWLNIGDTYAWDMQKGDNSGWGKHEWIDGPLPGHSRPLPENIKPKDLCGIPWRVAFALQADGWWLRSDIIWHKPNPMPESVTDRPTKAHEYLFLLAKSEQYFYDAVAIRERSVTNDVRRPYGSEGAWALDGRPIEQRHGGESRGRGGINAFRGQGSNRNGEKGHANRDGRDMRDIGVGTSRNRRSVWTISTYPFPGAHFATFPPALVEPCIKAGTSEAGCCSKCGKPWERISETELVPTKKASWNSVIDGRDIAADKNDQGSNRAKNGHKPGWINRITTLGFSPTCICEAAARPAIVLDPFAGSCTTLQAARFLGRDAIGLDLSYRYLSQEAKDRLQITDYEAWTEGQAIQAQESEGDHPWFDRLYSEDKGNH